VWSLVVWLTFIMAIVSFTCSGLLMSHSLASLLSLSMVVVMVSSANPFFLSCHAQDII